MILSPILLIVGLLVKVDSQGPIFYRQARVGRNFIPFILYKFRSMYTDARNRGPLITTRGDPRITRIGKFLRKSKIDELPQLFNVLKGDMSLVGPRPEVEKYVKIYEKDYQEILTVRPGMTDISSVKFSNEEDILAKSDNSDQYYINVILPQKIELNKEYIAKASLRFDLGLIVRTIVKIIK